MSPRQDQILEIAIVQTDHLGRDVTEWTTRVNPEGPVGATHIHGITQADLEHAPTFAQVAPQIASLLSGRGIVARNANFDVAFLRNEFMRAGWDWPEVPQLCTLNCARSLLPGQPRYSLQACCTTIGVPLFDAHGALGDARATVGLLQSFLDPRIGRTTAHEFMSLTHIATTVTWPTGPSKPPVVFVPRQVTQRVRRTPKKGIAPLLEQIDVDDVLKHEPQRNAASYVEVLLSSLADREVSDNELRALKELREINDLSSEQTEAIHHAVAAALTDLAVADNVFNKYERDEIKEILNLLGIPEKHVSTHFTQAQVRRYTQMSVGLPPLPPSWPLGEPLRVGDRVVFTGIDDAIRERLEIIARKRGVYIGGAVAKNTAMLVTDGSYHGQKLQKATELDTRIVTSEQFDHMLQWIKPYQ